MAPLIAIYSRQSLGQPRDVLEDAIEELLGKRGIVTGGGAGVDGWNIDIELYDSTEERAIENEIVEFLRRWPVPQDAWMVIEDRRLEIYGEHR